MQREVYEGTVRLDRLPVKQRGRDFEIAAVRLSEKECNIVIEVDKLILALHDNGTSVGLIEALGQVRDDAQQVASRLREGNVGEITQLIEVDIIKPLEEILDMFQRPCAPTRTPTPPTTNRAFRWRGWDRK